MTDEREILLALLAVPECRVRAGLPASGPLSLRQIARYTGYGVTTIRKIEQRAIRKMIPHFQEPTLPSMTDLVTLTPEDDNVAGSELKEEVQPQVVEANSLYSTMLQHAATAKTASKLAVSCAIQLGKLLCEIKAGSKRGEWECLFTDDPSKRNHDSVFYFSARTARKYMNLYSKVSEQLPDSDRPRLDAACETRQPDKPLPPDLLGKAGECESLTQCYVSFGIVSRPITPRKHPLLTIDDNRNLNGRPTKAELAARPQPTIEQQTQRALEDAAFIVKLLQSFTRARTTILMPPADLELLVKDLRYFAKQLEMIRR